MNEARFLSSQEPATHGANALDKKPRQAPRPDAETRRKAAAKKALLAEQSAVKMPAIHEIASAEEETSEILDDEIEIVQEVEAAEDREPGALQLADVVPAFEIKGFSGIEVTITMQKKKERLQDGTRDQDNILADPETGLNGVGDGMGGEGNGAEASIALEATLPEHFKQALQDLQRESLSNLQKKLKGVRILHVQTDAPSGTEVLTQPDLIEKTRLLEDHLLADPALARKALALVESLKLTNNNVRESKGKTTVCINLVHTQPDGRKFAIIANAGDSVAFVQRQNGELLQATQEDNMLNYLKEKNIVDDVLLQKMRAQPNEKLLQGKYSYKDLKRSVVEQRVLGSQGDPVITLTVVEVKTGDKILTVSDGVTDVLENANGETDLRRISQVLSQKNPIDRMNALRELASNATSAAKENDDIAASEVTVL